LEKLKVFFCTDGIFPHNVGGMQRHSRLLIVHLAKSGQLKLVVIHPHKENVFSPDLGIEEISIQPIDSGKNYLLECYRYSERIYDIIKDHPKSVVYSQGLCVWNNIKKLKQPLIVNPHGLEPYQVISFKEKLIAIPFKLIFNYIFKHSSFVVSLGGMLTQILKQRVKSDRTQIEVLPNGVQLPEHTIVKSFNKVRLNLLFVARFAHNKGIAILLQAIKELDEEGWNDKLEFILGGKGPLFEYYSTNYNYKNVNYLGFISDKQLINLYKNADLFVFPTLFEGMPTVVLEAMSFGLPIIVSDVGATAELVDNTNGYLIQKNNVRELKTAIIDFYKLSEASKLKLSEASFQKVVNDYNWNTISKKYIEMFKKASLKI
jgi:glycosyltransferase involved in cell wall biosynthesis